MWFKGNNLEKVSVIWYDDNKIDISSCNLYCSPRVCSGNHKVYKSLVDGEMFTDDECKAKSSADYLGTTLNKYDIKTIKNIISYLTTEELEKAKKNVLTDEDITNIIDRIFYEEKNLEKIKKAN